MVTKRVLVLDTITLLFAIFGRYGEKRIYRLCRARHVRLATSFPLLAELQRALRYPRFGLVDHQIDRIVQDVTSHAFVVEPRERIDLIRDDPKDNRLLECAAAAGADILVSSDPHLLEIAIFRDILILPADSAYALLPAYF